jgi:hypothetical protein
MPANDKWDFTQRFSWLTINQLNKKLITLDSLYWVPVTFVMPIRLSVCLSVCPQLQAHIYYWASLRVSWYWSVLLKTDDKNQNCLKSGKKSGAVCENISTFHCCRRHCIAIKAFYSLLGTITYRPVYSIGVGFPSFLGALFMILWNEYSLQFH